MKIGKIVLILFLVVIAASCFTIFESNRIITKAAKGKMYSSAWTIPFNRVGLLLGTSRTMADGRINLFYSYRILAAAELIRAEKIKYLVVSGDNGRAEYNEPEAMRSDLIKAGVDSTIIFLDYAGFRTFDSIKRLKEIFGQDSVKVISQKFHNERAIYIAGEEGISAIGYNSREVGAREGLRIMIRERLARVKVFLDSWFGTKPRYLGKKVLIP
jgi:SanA protein